ncbi:MAG: hypothetical protein R6W82_02070 [bacterium]
MMRSPSLIRQPLTLLLAAGLALSGCSKSTDPDSSPPEPGGAGIISASEVGSYTLTLFWTPATDDGTEQEVIEYRLVRSTSPDLATMEDCTAHGTVVLDWSANTLLFEESGLAAETTYYYNVLARDEAENACAYAMLAVETGPPTDVDGTSPVPGNAGSISFMQVAGDSCLVVWSPATDDVSAQPALSYTVVRSDGPDVLTVTDAQANGTTVIDWTADTYTARDRGLAGESRYYYNVLVRDEASNTAAYMMAELNTPDATPPTPGDGGTIASEDSTFTSIRVSWHPAGDTRTLPGGLQYRVVYSLDPDVATVAEAQVNGTISMDWTTVSSTEWEMTGLQPDTSYYVNVLVRDAAGNMAAYTMETLHTLFEGVFYARGGMQGDVIRVRLDGTHPRTVFTGLSTNGVRMALHQGLGTIYIANTDEITQGDPRTGETSTFNDGAWLAQDVAVDEVGGKVYWTSGFSGLGSADTDGSGAVYIVSPLVEPYQSIYGVAVDPTGGKVYWTNAEVGELRRCSPDGGSQELFLDRSLPIWAADVDTVDGRIYWVERDPGRDGAIYRCSVAGSAVETVVDSTAGQVIYDLDLDVTGRKVYWISWDGIWRSELDGTSPESVAAVTDGVSLVLHLHR